MVKSKHYNCFRDIYVWHCRVYFYSCRNYTVFILSMLISRENNPILFWNFWLDVVSCGFMNTSINAPVVLTKNKYKKNFLCRKNNLMSYWLLFLVFVTFAGKWLITEKKMEVFLSIYRESLKTKQLSIRIINRFISSQKIKASSVSSSSIFIHIFIYLFI